MPAESEWLEEDDGVDTEIAQHPGRGFARPGSLDDAFDSASKGHLATARELAQEANQNFLILRTPVGGVKLALSHARVLKAVWSCWSRKRLLKDEEPGVSPAEIGAELNEEGSTIDHILVTLTRNRVLRSVTTHVGWRGARVRYYPTQGAVQLLAFAEVLPHGSFVQVGKTTKVWKSRQDGAPGDLFAYARLLRGGVDQGVTA